MTPQVHRIRGARLFRPTAACPRDVLILTFWC
jgi:hypothetical protein